MEMSTHTSAEHRHPAGGSSTGDARAHQQWRATVRILQGELKRLKWQHAEVGEVPLLGEVSPDSGGSGSGDVQSEELLSEARILRHHKNRLETRMQILEDHNKQLESQLHRLRELLLQPSIDDSKSSCTSQMDSESKCMTDDKRGTPDTEAADDMDSGTREVSLHLEDIMEKLRNAFPNTKDKELCGGDTTNQESPTLPS